MHEFEWYQSDLFEIDRKNFEKDKKKNGRKIPMEEQHF